MNNQRTPINSRISKLLAVIVLVLTVLGTAQAATLTVTNTNDSGAGSLRGVLASAVSGDTIVFDTAGVFATPQTINLTSGELTLEIEDHGRGIGPKSSARGLGIVAMRERAALLGGTLDFLPRAGGGTIVRLRVPVAVGRT